MNSPIVEVWRGIWRGAAGENKCELRARTADGREWVFSLTCGGEVSYWHESGKPYRNGEEMYDLNATAFGADEVRAM